MDTPGGVLVILGLTFVSLNILSIGVLMWFYGRRIVGILRMPAMLHEPLVGEQEHELVPQHENENRDMLDADIRNAQNDASV